MRVAANACCFSFGCPASPGACGGDLDECWMVME